MYQLTGIGNAIIDIIIEISEEDFSTLGYEKGTMNLVEESEQKKLLEKFSDNNTKMSSGGAVANSMVVATQMGLKTSYIGAYADDDYGNFYKKDFEKIGIDISIQSVKGKTSGTSVILVTPDGERTMQTCLGVASELSEEQIEEEMIENSEYILIEGYLLSSDPAFKAVEKIVSLAKKYDRKIIIALSAPFIVEVFGERLKQIMKSSDICFANLVEAQAYTGLNDSKEVIDKLSKEVSHSIVTLNKEGALISLLGEVYNVAGEVVDPVDSTGAGDAFCGAYLAEYIKGSNPNTAGEKACKIAGRVVQQVGARLENI